MGALDFAGGTVVRVNAAAAALVAALVIGPRRDDKKVALSPHSVPFPRVSTARASISTGRWATTRGTTCCPTGPARF